ncbi:MAG TPA: hypothetical protein VEY69_17645 [Lautropia sp.]|nr:hypothetical protein [Lautropia sp.]
MPISIRMHLSLSKWTLKLLPMPMPDRTLERMPVRTLERMPVRALDWMPQRMSKVAAAPQPQPSPTPSQARPATVRLFRAGEAADSR